MNDFQSVTLTTILRGPFPYQEISYETFPSIFGVCLVATCEDKICYMGFSEDSSLLIKDLKGRFPDVIFHEKKPSLFTSELKYRGTEGLHLLVQGTPFQIQVWKILMEIERGKVTSYQHIAEKLGDIKKVRAVANAIGDNPISLFIPCHRVVHKRGTLGGYYWGLDIKKKMLNWEKPN